MKELNISRWTLIALFIISIIVLGTFFLFGYDTPWEENPKMNNPANTDLLLWFIVAMFVITLISTIYSVIMQIAQGSSIGNDTGLAKHTGKIAVGILVLSLVVGFVCGMNDVDKLFINGKEWLPTAEENVTANIITGVSMISIIILSIITFVVTIISLVAGALKK
mgnify:CR=1 FL=1